MIDEAARATEPLTDVASVQDVPAKMDFRAFCKLCHLAFSPRLERALNKLRKKAKAELLPGYLAREDLASSGRCSPIKQEPTDGDVDASIDGDLVLRTYNEHNPTTGLLTDLRVRREEGRLANFAVKQHSGSSLR